MCGGDGAANFVSCQPYCPAGNDETRIASEAYYGYCVKFIKELCEVAQEFIDEETYAQECSKEAIAAGGIGADEDEDSEKR
jgi:predicted SPOUT superfamily RNA methylase MTH1